MNDRIRSRLQDVTDAAAAIQNWTEKHSYENMVTDLMVESAFILQFERIGEALRVVRDADCAFEEVMPEINQWIGLRHRLVHDYREIDLELLWTIAVADIPLLLRTVQNLLEV